MVDDLNQPTKRLAKKAEVPALSSLFQFHSDSTDEFIQVDPSVIVTSECRGVANK